MATRALSGLVPGFGLNQRTHQPIHPPPTLPGDFSEMIERQKLVIEQQHALSIFNSSTMGFGFLFPTELLVPLDGLQEYIEEDFSTIPKEPLVKEILKGTTKINEEEIKKRIDVYLKHI